MGATNSRPEEDMSLKLCYDRKKFVRKAIDCRCVLVEAHLNYIQSLKDTGRVLLEFFKPRVPIESDLQDSTDAIKEPLVPKEMHSNECSTRRTEEIVAPPSVTIMTEKHEDSVSAPSPWDYFDLSHPVDDQLSAPKINGCNQGLVHGGDTRTTLNAKGEQNARQRNLKILEIEEEDEINFVLGRNVSIKFDKDRYEPLFEGIVGSFENINLASDMLDAISSPSVDSVSTEISEVFSMARSRSPELSPLRELALSVSEVVNLTKLVDTDEIENIVGLKANPNALYLSMKDIDQLYLKAFECGQEVLRMLEANHFHYHLPAPKQKGQSKRSWSLITCFCHKEETNQVSKELGEASKRYLTSQRNMTARSFSSIASQNSGEDPLANSSNGIYGMRSGSHISTLERLYAWENKLHDEVKACEIIRCQYNQKCKLLKHQESKAESANMVDKTRAVIKDLHSQIGVSIKRMETISSRIIRIRDLELQPQFEELIKGLGNMWQKMHECHKRQLDIISAIPTKIPMNSADRQLIKNHFEQQLSLTSSNFTRLIYSYQLYLKEIEGWLLKCFLFPEKPAKKATKHQQHILVSKYSPPILLTCRSWLEGLEKLAAETSNLSSLNDNHHEENLRNTKNSVEESNSFCTRLVQNFIQLMKLSDSSAKMYNEIDRSIQEASIKYEQLRKPQR